MVCKYGSLSTLYTARLLSTSTKWNKTFFNLTVLLAGTDESQEPRVGADS